MEDAIPGVPGAYPGTPADESGPSPSFAPLRRHHQHEQHEHNKLHKANDPRGHRHTDSGVGLTESQPIYPSSVDESKPRAFSENTPATTTFAYQTQHSTPPHEANYTHAARHDGTAEPVQESVQAPGPETTKDTESKTAGDKAKPGNTTPPYWGDLPKAMRGGIYNTVMGHGSASDDHDQHHGLPQRGGVYNTVAGHGSQDEESRRHATSHLATEVPTSQPGADALQILAAPLPGIAEEREKEKTADHVATETSRSGIARGFLPETAVRDDVALLAAAGAPSHTQQVSPQSSTRGSHNESLNTGTDFAATQRAFPLSSSPDRSYRRSQDVAAHEKQQQSAESYTDRDALAMAAGVGVAGTAPLAASEQKDKPKKLKKQKEPSPSAKIRQRSEDETIADKAVTTSSPSRRSHDRSARSERRSSDESPPSEKKHHGILGIFHRRKDSKGEKDRTRSDKDVAEPKSDEQPRHSSHKEDATVATAAAGSGAHGLFHRHKDDENKHKDQRSNSEPAARQSQETKQRSRRMSANQSAAAAVAESAGAFGVLYQKPQEKDVNERQSRKSVDTAAPPAPPERSPKRRSLTPPSSTAFAAETAHAPPTGQGAQSYSAVQSRDDSANYAGAGVAAGLGASIFADSGLPSQQEESNRSNLTQPQTGATLFNYENPREAPPTPANAATAKSRQSQVSPVRSPKSPSPRASEVVTNDPSNYNTLASGTASGVKTSAGSSSDETRTHGSDAYLYLPSGTATGMKVSTSSDRDAHSASKSEERTGDGESGLYNVLPSGTPSGVKLGSKASRSSMTEPESRTLSKHGDGQYNTLPSGTASGIVVEHQHKAPVQAETEPQAARHSSGAGPNANARAQRAQQAIMSPEVLPDTYRAQSHPLPSTEYIPAPTGSHASAMDPALAAATGAWAGKTAVGQGSATDQGRVMHKCEYCGRDNDISSQFTKENMAKMTKK